VSSYTLDGVRARAVADRDADMDALKVENQRLRKQLMVLDTSRAQTLMTLQRCKDETRRAYRDLGRLPQYQTQYVPQQRMPRPRDSRGRFVSQQTQPLVGAM